MHVLFLNSWYPNKIHLTNGDFVQEHARAVARHCTVICLQVQGIENQKEAYIIDKKWIEKVLEITIYYPQIKGNSFIASFQKKRKQHTAFLYGYKKLSVDFPIIDVVHLNVAFPAGFFALYLKQKFNIPFIITEHNTRYINNATTFSIFELYFIKRIFLNSSYICPVSKLLQKEMENKGIRGNYNVIPNVINTELFTFKQKKIKNRIEILHVSSLKNEHKNYKGMLRVIKKLSITRNDFTLTIVSNADLTPSIAYSKSIQLSQTVFKTKQSYCREDIAKAMQQSDLFLLFSNYETFSLVVAESLSCGTPVIATGVGVISEIITGKNGVLVEVGNEDDLWNKLNTILDSIKSFDSEKIAKETQQLYNYEKVGKLYYYLYKKTIQQKTL